MKVEINLGDKVNSEGEICIGMWYILKEEDYIYLIKVENIQDDFIKYEGIDLSDGSGIIAGRIFGEVDIYKFPIVEE